MAAAEQTIPIQREENTKPNHNLLHKIKQAANEMGKKVVAGVQNVVVAGVQNVVVAGVQNVVVAGVRGIVVRVCRDWVAFEEELAENPPPPRNDLIVTGLIGFVAIKAQGDQGFPFRTHPGLFKISIISLLLSGFASAAERLLVPIRLRAVACLGRAVAERAGNQSGDGVVISYDSLLFVSAPRKRGNAAAQKARLVR